MDLDFSKGKINLVLCPTDLRYGYNKLSLLAQTTLGTLVSQMFLGRLNSLPALFDRAYRLSQFFKNRF